MVSNAKTDTKSQLDKFKEAAKELGTDDSEEAFDAALKRVAKAKPPASPSQRKRRLLED